MGGAEPSVSRRLREPWVELASLSQALAVADFAEADFGAGPGDAHFPGLQQMG